MLWSKNGRTRETAASAYWYMLGEGWVVVDAAGLDPLPLPTAQPAHVVTSMEATNGILTVTYADGAVESFPVGGTGTGGTGPGAQANLTVDTDGVLYYVATGGTRVLAVDTDGVLYATTAV